ATLEEPGSGAPAAPGGGGGGGGGGPPGGGGGGGGPPGDCISALPLEREGLAGGPPGNGADLGRGGDLNEGLDQGVSSGGDPSGEELMAFLTEKAEGADFVITARGGRGGGGTGSNGACELEPNVRAPASNRTIREREGGAAVG
uniref:Uncharacterized protein n=1 Tax=Amphimedon queenslandica TaxID=400682 RepID=A0A1X7V0H5_AMPQE